MAAKRYHERWIGIAGNASNATLRFVEWVHELAPDGEPLCRVKAGGRHISRYPTGDPVDCRDCMIIQRNVIRYALAQRRRP